MMDERLRFVKWFLRFETLLMFCLIASGIYLIADSFRAVPVQKWEVVRGPVTDRDRIFELEFEVAKLKGKMQRVECKIDGGPACE